MANYVEKNRSFLIAGDARKTGLADGSVDAVVIKDTVNHMSYENALKAVLETYRILENNEGRAYINVSKAHAKSLVSELNTRFGVRSAELRPDTSSSESLFGNKQVINLVLRKGDSKTKMDFDDSVSLDQGAQLVARQIRQATTEHLQRQRVLSMDARGYGFDAVYSSIISHLNTMPIGQRFDVINMTSSDATSLVQSIERRYGKGVQTSSTFEGLTNPQFSAWIANRNDLSFGVTQASTFQTLQDSAYRASQVPITVSIQRNW
ncbi:MAG: class I SAM-dependent methyltransferase [Bdellovibrionaceae bacterium]|nr:class I SAM-dependent methyltransferase [Pseudobdellovibrionaceae bacterium]